MDLSMRRKLRKLGNEVIVEEEGITLKEGEKAVGTRKVIDTYKVDAILNIKKRIESDIQNALKQKEQIEVKLEEIKKKINLREKNKLEEFVRMQEKAKVYLEYKKNTDALHNISQWVTNLEKQVEEIGDAVPEK